jgi:hypothetical protein
LIEFDIMQSPDVLNVGPDAWDYNFIYAGELCQLR